MKEDKKVAAVQRLQKLAGELKTAYGKAARCVSEALRPIEAAVSEIGETWRPVHYAESLRDGQGDAARRPESCFAHETFVNGDETDYVLCVARGQDRKCGFYASICKYRIRPDDGGGNGKGRASVEIQKTSLVPLGHLPIPVRIKLLDVVDGFAEAYEHHVRERRQGLLEGLGDFRDPEPEEERMIVDGGATQINDPVAELEAGVESRAEKGGAAAKKASETKAAAKGKKKPAEAAAAAAEVKSASKKDVEPEDIADPMDEAVEAERIEKVPDTLDEGVAAAEEKTVAETAKAAPKPKVRKPRSVVTSPDSDIPIEAWVPMRR